MMKISHNETTLLIGYIHEISGISLDSSKEYLIESRLAPVLKDYNCNSYGDLYHLAKSDTRHQIDARIISAISTNETSFFRDSNTFDLLKYKLLPDHMDNTVKKGGRKTLRIWSAACSSGQEVYTIGICIKELLGATLAQWDIKIVATDISNSVISYASRGAYSEMEVQRGLSQERLNRFFKLKENRWVINDEIRALACFKTINLLKDTAGPERFDIIFCRNVAIYFSQENRKKLFEGIARQMNPGGSLIVGSTENLSTITNAYKRSSYHNAIVFKLAS